MTSERSFDHCNHCGSETWHSESEPFKNRAEVVDEGVTISFCETSAMLQCQVCKRTQLRVRKWNSENGDCGQSFFPPHSMHKAPPWLKELPSEYRVLALQIYPALDAGSYGLALMGARALLDIYISRHSAVQNDFKKKLEDLQKSGSLSPKQIEILVPTFDAGSAAAHRGFIPTESNVLTALQVVENLIHQDVLGVKTLSLKKETPPDTRRKK